jgi:hypothetical protein
LEIHPIDIVLTVRPSPSFDVSFDEMASISLVSQLDSARICLNALITEHVYGTTSIITKIVIKHYKESGWRQIKAIIGGNDHEIRVESRNKLEGGDINNLGTRGIYDMFYNPIDGLLDNEIKDEGILDGLSKNSKNYASRAVVGTSAFTSKLTGGIGKTVSILTFDKDFYRSRESRRMNVTKSIGEGLKVGSKEFGLNVAEGTYLYLSIYISHTKTTIYLLKC